MWKLYLMKFWKLHSTVKYNVNINVTGNVYIAFIKWFHYSSIFISFSYQSYSISWWINPFIPLSITGLNEKVYSILHFKKDKNRVSNKNQYKIILFLSVLFVCLQGCGIIYQPYNHIHYLFILSSVIKIRR